MSYPTYTDSPHKGLTIPMWALIFSVVLSVVASYLLIHQGNFGS